MRGQEEKGDRGRKRGGGSGDGKETISKDEKINRKGRKLVEFIEEKGWCVFNGNVKGDEKGEYTFTGGKGCIVIDYVMRDGK